jgi:holo-[acyl-carrier protein] synthase
VEDELTGSPAASPSAASSAVRPPAATVDGLLVDGPESWLGLTVIAVGTDLVDIDRMRDIVDRQPSFVTRVYTEGERAYCDARKDPAERYAARFAAKEAVLKAIGTGLGGADFDEIEVVKDDAGAPHLHLHGRAQAKAEALGIVAWLITLTHSNHVAQATVAGLGPVGSGIQHPRDPDRADA